VRCRRRGTAKDPEVRVGGEPSHDPRDPSPRYAGSQKLTVFMGVWHLHLCGNVDPDAREGAQNSLAPGSAAYALTYSSSKEHCVGALIAAGAFWKNEVA
jgi:hypothetical protein